MLDRFGSPIVVGWSASHLLWLRAAMTLEAHEQRQALEDIASMTGRSYAAIWRMKHKLLANDREERFRQIRLENLTLASKRYLASVENHG